MKKLFAILLALTVLVALVSCNGNQGNNQGNNNNNDVPVMTYDEYMAADVDAPVCVEVYVQATQSWWFDNDDGYGKITVYAADADGAYFIYEMKCDEADAEKLTEGTKIKVKGYKAVWSGEIEIMDPTFEFVEGADKFVAEAKDLTDKLGTDELVDYQNQLATFKGMTVKSISYKNDQVGNDIYITLTKGEAEYSFCVESYLTGLDTFVYQTAMTLAAGDVIDVTGFVYWYENVNTHITGIDFVSQHTMTYAEYDAAPVGCRVTVEAFVQDHQSWWEDKITVYAADADGAYFIYELACPEAQKNEIVPGAKIKVTGYKAEWSGEVEIVDATYQLVEAEPFIAEAKDLTDKLGTDELIDYQNQLAIFKDMTVKEIAYKNGEVGNDIYVKLTKGEAEYSFCVESYLTGADTEVYQAVSALTAGQVIDIEGFLYWYEGPNTHITAITVK